MSKAPTAADLLAAHGIGPDDISKLIQIDTNADDCIRISLPERFAPPIVAALLAMFASSVLDVGKASAQADTNTQDIISRLRAH